MLEIIKERGIETEKKTTLDFYNEKDELCAGFDLDESANPIMLCEEARNNYQDLLDKVKNSGWSSRVNTCEYTFRTDAVARCHCGEEFELHDQYLGACECPNCGQWYNLFGQELSDPSTWNKGPYHTASIIIGIALCATEPYLLRALMIFLLRVLK